MEYNQNSLHENNNHNSNTVKLLIIIVVVSVLIIGGIAIFAIAFMNKIDASEDEDKTLKAETTEHESNEESLNNTEIAATEAKDDATTKSIDELTTDTEESEDYYNTSFDSNGAEDLQGYPELRDFLKNIAECITEYGVDGSTSYSDTPIGVVRSDYYFYAIADFDSDGSAELMICSQEMTMDDSKVYSKGYEFYEYDESTENVVMCGSGYCDDHNDKLIFYSNGIIFDETIYDYFAVKGSIFNDIGIYPLTTPDGVEYKYHMGGNISFSNSAEEGNYDHYLYSVGFNDNGFGEFLKTYSDKEYNDLMRKMRDSELIIRITVFNETYIKLLLQGE